ncbi:MAG: hypothetical protein EOO73_17050 [Myxococcales bacterium]|nr:MAG: hypothetical protein EOO73_17050 [Myxococcales bacterium]
MRWTERSGLYCGLAACALLFAACGHGGDRPPENGGTQLNRPESSRGVDGTPPVSKPPDVPAETFEGNPGKAGGDEPQTPAPAGSAPPTGGL